jgi:excisionase family DNA binding protein
MAEYLKLAEVARRLDVSEKTARRYVKSGVLPSVFIGNKYRVSEDDLQEYVRGARVEPGGGRPKVLAPAIAS